VALALAASPDRWVDPVVVADALRGAPAIARVMAIKAHDEGVRTAVVIEASEPVAYVTTQPDPLTVFVDLRNVSAEGVLNTALAGTRHISGVTLEDVTSSDGQAMARVRVRMRMPAPHRVRSTRNLILVEVDRAPGRNPTSEGPVAERSEIPLPIALEPRIPEAAPRKAPTAARATPAVTTASTTLQRVRATASARSVSILLSGTGKLEASSVHDAPGDVPRLVLDFVDVAPSTPPTTWVSQEPVDKVRVALNQRAPAVTRVVIDLLRRTSYRLEAEGEGGKDLRIVFDKSAPAGAPPPAPAQSNQTAPVANADGPVDLLTVLTPPAALEREVAAAPEVAPPGRSAAPAALSPPAGLSPEPVLEGRTVLVRAENAPALAAARIEPERVTPPYVVIAAPERMGPMSGGIWAPANRMVTATPPLPPVPEPEVSAGVPAASVETASMETASAQAANRQAAGMPAPEPVSPAVPDMAPPTAAQQSVVAPAVPPAPPTPQTPMVPAQIIQPSGGRVFTGHPVSLDFQGADLRAVLRTFAEISGLNLVIDPSVTGSVDVTLRDVPWDQALDLILKANKLGYVIEGTIVRIAPLTALSEEEAQRRKLAEEQALAGTLSVITKPLSYARAEDIRTLITRSALTPRGEVEVDVRTNTLIIRDLPGALQVATDLITTLDTPQPQVEIEARIVQTNRDFARSLGVQWGVSGRLAPELGNTLPLAFPNQGSLTGRTGGTQGPPGQPSESAATAVNLGVQGASSALGLSIGSVNGAINLDVALSALERTGKGRLLSTPRVSTQNNVEAEITQGVQIPIQTVANNTVTVTFKDAALTLKVVPQITASGTVIMRIAVENATPDFTRSVNNIPPINTQRAFTQVLVKDGDTTVIGGIYVSSETDQTDRTPGLHRIPLLGWLFKRDLNTDESRELLIFITPRIISS
jgi:type IV pilus assembly protein PilQ